jgi:hypothetical protein
MERSPENRKYDVAFSFRVADLPLAQRLADAISPLRSFVYAREQGKIVMRDGMEVFGEAFAIDSRLNVILYRAGYGEQGWTNFEREIIKARCLGNEGWSSFALIRTDTSPVPNWIPPTYIYGDAAMMDVEALGAVVKLRAKLAGASVQSESTVSRMARLAEQKKFDAETERLATGAEAFAAVEENRQTLHANISDAIAAHLGKGSGFDGESGFGAGIFGANVGPIGCLLNYENPYGNVTSGKLKIRFLRGRIAIPGTRQVSWEFPTAISSQTATVTRSRALGWCWLFRGQPRTSAEIGDLILDEMTRLNA